MTVQDKEQVNVDVLNVDYLANKDFLHVDRNIIVKINQLKMELEIISKILVFLEGKLGTKESHRKHVTQVSSISPGTWRKKIAELEGSNCLQNNSTSINGRKDSFVLTAKTISILIHFLKCHGKEIPEFEDLLKNSFYAELFGDLHASEG